MTSGFLPAALAILGSGFWTLSCRVSQGVASWSSQSLVDVCAHVSSHRDFYRSSRAQCLPRTSRGPFRSVHFCSIFFSACFLASITSIVLSSRSLILSPGCSDLPLNPSAEFCISVTVLSHPEVSFWFLCRFSVFIPISLLSVHCFLDFLHIWHLFFKHIQNFF